MSELTNKEKELNKKLGEVFLYEYGQEYTDQICEETDSLHEKYNNLDVPDTMDIWFTNFASDLKAKEQKRRFQDIRMIIAKRVAIFLVAFLAISGSLTFGVEAFRLKFFNIFFTDNDTHTELDIHEDDNTNLIKPIGWNHYYFPSFLPEGYDLDEYSGVEGYRTLYFSDNSNTITVKEIAGEQDYFANIDSENVIPEELSINGNKGIYVFKSGKSMLAWIIDDSLLTISGPISRDKIIEIAENIKKVE